ncbi:YciI family protein [Halomonas salifodinae]|uniref:YciI family protein n=1 Tax=Halomonas salifodinae TaxID=438745 RepID=A0ABW2EZR0_9GAMM
MRFMILVKASQDSEAGKLPSQELLEAMGKYNEALVEAGIMLAGEGLWPSSEGARVRFRDDERLVTDGPFAETKELVAGYWLWQVASMEEAIEWVKRCPNPMPGTEAEIEIRRVFEAEDFGEAFTPELREQEAQLRERLGE